MATTEGLLEQIIHRDNLNLAYRKVKRNGGSAGIDNMTVEEALPYLKEHGQELVTEIMEGKYKPKPVKRVEIPKPTGGKRQLGIPTVIDRMIQQAMVQVINPYFEEVFSEHSYGFREGRSAHDALRQAKRYIAEGHREVVDIDLEKFFDRVNHDMLMHRVSKVIEDKRVLKLIRAYLNAGVMMDGVVVKNEEGTPQGGPLSPLLSNIMLDDLDKELERRGLSFVRYADDCNIYVKSPRAAERVMKGVTEYIEKKLKLKVNHDKSEIGSFF
jgi:RNA-directed DNA polymerase